MEKFIQMLGSNQVANPNLHVKEIADSNSLSEALGIPEQRARELQKTAFVLAMSGNTVSAVISQVSRLCEHPNELALVGATVGKLCSQK